MAGTWQVQVDFSGFEGEGKGVKSEAEGTGLRVLPPWMVKQGMNLTEAQRGEVKQEAKMASPELSEDKKFDTESASAMSPSGQVGMKSKRDEDEGEDNVAWEEAPIPITGYVEADATADDADCIDWEEG